MNVKPIKVFITYAHTDTKYREELQTQLSVMEQNKEITVWADNEILAGDKWRDEINKKLSECDVLLYLTSADSLKSKNCNKELSDVLKKNNISVIPIILDHCDWNHHELSNIQAIPSDNGNVRPVCGWRPRSKAWKTVVEDLRRTISELKKQETDKADQGPDGTNEANAEDFFQAGNIAAFLGQHESAISIYDEAIELNPQDADAYNNRGNAKRQSNDPTARQDFEKALTLAKEQGLTEAAQKAQGELDNLERIKSIQKILNEIENKAFNDDYIYRGEPECHGKISSNLYRQYKDIDAEDFDIKIVQDEIIKETGGYTNLKDKFEIMAELQHYGGKTNFIDFTKDYHISLFFACDGCPGKDGRVVLKRNSKTEAYELYEPRSPLNRIIAQKSIFIHPFKGWLNLQEEEVICIPAKLKKDLLEHLNKYHGISTAIIYNDLHGFIKNKQSHQNAYTEFYTGVTAYAKAIKEKERDKKEEYLKEAIENYKTVIQLNPLHAGAYNNRGIAKGYLDEYQAAKADFDKAIELHPQLAEAYFNRGIAKYHLGDYQGEIADYDKAIELNPQYAAAYYIRGLAKADLGDYQGAIADLDKAIELNPQFAEAYYNRGLAKKQLNDPTARQDFEKALTLAKKQGLTEAAQAAQGELDALDNQ